MTGSPCANRRLGPEPDLVEPREPYALCKQVSPGRYQIESWDGVHKCARGGQHPPASARPPRSRRTPGTMPDGAPRRVPARPHASPPLLCCGGLNGDVGAEARVGFAPCGATREEGAGRFLWRFSVGPVTGLVTRTEDGGSEPIVRGMCFEFLPRRAYFKVTSRGCARCRCGVSHTPPAS